LPTPPPPPGPSWPPEALPLPDPNDEARGLAADELALARRWGDPHAIGASLRVLGLIESGKAGIGLVREGGGGGRRRRGRPRGRAPAGDRADRGPPAAPGGRRPRATERRLRARRAGE